MEIHLKFQFRTALCGCFIQWPKLPQMLRSILCNITNCYLAVEYDIFSLNVSFAQSKFLRIPYLNFMLSVFPCFGESLDVTCKQLSLFATACSLFSRIGHHGWRPTSSIVQFWYLVLHECSTHFGEDFLCLGL